MNILTKLYFVLKSPFGGLGGFPIFRGYRGLLPLLLLFLTFSCQKEEKPSVGMNKITIGRTTPGTLSYATATVSAAIESIKGNKVIQYGHCWGTAQNPVIDGSKTTLGSLSEAKTFTSQLENLLPNTSYFIRVYVTTPYETVYGAETTFKTIDYTKPTVATVVISGATPYLATSGGNVTAVGGLPVTARGVVWNTTSEPTITSKIGITTDGAGIGLFTSQLTNLLPGTTYYVRSYATNSKDTGYGEPFTFTTKGISAPEVTTANVTGILTTSAISGGNVTNDGNLEITGRGVCWKLAGQNPTINDSKTSDGKGPGSFISNLTGLQPNADYYLSAYATNSQGTVYGVQILFTTAKILSLATVTTSTSTSITSNSAVLGGSVTSDGNAMVTERGVCYSTIPNPTIQNAKLAIGSGIGTFSNSVAGLTANTTYYVQAYAINNQGTAYGNEQNFKTSLVLSVANLTTSTPTNLTSTSATLGGNITSDGNAIITERGICYSTTANPTTSSTKVSVGSGTGTFSNFVTGLTANTTYYVRAYAINSQGIAYGNEVNYKTTLSGTIGTVTDIDGNVYSTVIIGTQVWMVENLKTTKYNDGTAVPNITDGAVWNNLTTPGYCWYNNDISTFKNTYGALYNWYAVNTGKLCPIGWHVPTDAEWTTLTTYLGGESVAGGKLKETGTNHWQTPNIGATNETGFTALPAGYRNYDGTFIYIGKLGLWWSSTELVENVAKSRNMNGALIIVNRVNDMKQLGLSVRCVKD